MVFPRWLSRKNTRNLESGKIPLGGKEFFGLGMRPGSIPPVCGEGLAIAVTSGCMAADYYLKSNPRKGI